MVTCQPFRSLKATTYWSIYWLITLINNNGGPPLFSDVLLSSFFHVSSCIPSHSLRPPSSRNACSHSQSHLLPRGSSCHDWGLTCLRVFYLKWAVESNAFHYSLLTTVLMLCRFFCSPFCIKRKKFTRWMMRARWNMHDWSDHWLYGSLSGANCKHRLPAL